MECRLESRHEVGLIREGVIPIATPQWSAGWKAGMSFTVTASGDVTYLTAAMECRLESRHELAAVVALGPQVLVAAMECRLESRHESNPRSPRPPS